MPEGREQLEHRLAEVAQPGLAGYPRLGVWKRLEDAPPVTDRSFDDPSVNEEKEHRGGVPELDPSPDLGPAEIVFEVQPDVPGRFLQECRGMLVIAMGPIMRQPPCPGLDSVYGQVK